MKDSELKEFKELLLNMKMKILNGGILTNQEDLAISNDDLCDDTDLASCLISQNVSINMRQRELNKLRAIEDALYRIEEKSYGYCEECDEAIGKKRLLNQPFTTLCIIHAEEKERETFAQARA